MKNSTSFLNLISSPLIVYSLAFLCVGCSSSESDQSNQALEADEVTAEEKPELSLEGYSKVAGPNDKGRKLAIIVGINQYPDPDPDLPNLKRAVNDARSIRNILVDEFGYDPKAVELLENTSAKKVDFEQRIEEWLPLQKPTPKDSLLVFFAGHGDREGNIAFHDSLANRKDSWLPIKWLVEAVGQLPCRQKLVILGSCYSGNLFNTRPEKSSLPVQSANGKREASLTSRGNGPVISKEVVAHYTEYPCFLGISAGRNTTVVDELGEDNHSLFTWALLESMKERALMNHPDQIFFGRMLAADVERRVAATRNSPQIVDWGYLGEGRGDFLFKPSFPRDTHSQRLETARQKLSREKIIRQFSTAFKAYKGGNFHLASAKLRDLDESSRWKTSIAFKCLKNHVERPTKWSAEVPGQTIHHITFEGDDLRNTCVFSSDTCRVFDKKGTEIEVRNFHNFNEALGVQVPKSTNYITVAFQNKNTTEGDNQYSSTSILKLIQIPFGMGDAIREFSIELDHFDEEKPKHYTCSHSGNLLAVHDYGSLIVKSFQDPHYEKKLHIVETKERSSNYIGADLIAKLNIRGVEGDGFVVDSVFLSNDKLLAACDDLGRMLVWRLSDGARVKVINEDGGVSATCLDGGEIAFDKTFEPMDETLTSIASRYFSALTIQEKVGIWKDASNHTETREVIAAGFKDGSISVWDYGRSKLVRRWNAHRYGVKKVALSPQGKVLASISTKGQICLWSTKDWTLLAEWGQGDGGFFSWSADGTEIVSSNGNNVHVWSVAKQIADNSAIPFELNEHLRAYVSDGDVTANSDLSYVVATDVFDGKDNKKHMIFVCVDVHHPENTAETLIEESNGKVWFSVSGSQLYMADWINEEICFLSSHDLELDNDILSPTQRDEGQLFTSSSQSLAVQHGRYLLRTYEDSNAIEYWDLTKDLSIQEILENPTRIPIDSKKAFRIYISPNANFLIYAAPSNDHELNSAYYGGSSFCVVDLLTKEEVLKVSNEVKRDINSPEFLDNYILNTLVLEDQKLVALLVGDPLGEKKKIEVWDIRLKEKISSRDVKCQSDVFAHIPGELCLLVADKADLIFIEPYTGTEIGSFRVLGVDGSIRSVKFDGEGKKMLIEDYITKDFQFEKKLLLVP